MNLDVITVGGGLGGSTLASAVAQSGRRVLVLERERQFKDRVRGEVMLPWGVAAARRLGIVDRLLAAGGRQVPFFNTYVMGAQIEHRPLPMTTPTREASLNMYHPDLQETLLTEAVHAGAEVMRGAEVQSIAEREGGWTVTFSENARTRSVTARLVVGADGRFSSMRQMGGFTVRRDPDHLRIAGTLIEGTNVPDDGVHFCLGPGFATFIAPLGNGRARVYFIYVAALGDRKLSGKAKVGEFLEGCRATNVPSAWFDGDEPVVLDQNFGLLDRGLSLSRVDGAIDADVARADSWFVPTLEPIEECLRG